MRAPLAPRSGGRMPIHPDPDRPVPRGDCGQGYRRDGRDPQDTGTATSWFAVSRTSRRIHSAAARPGLPASTMPLICQRQTSGNLRMVSYDDRLVRLQAVLHRVLVIRIVWVLSE